MSPTTIPTPPTTSRSWSASTASTTGPGNLLEGLGKIVPRFGGYRLRLTDALDKISDDRAWLASPRCDSYHTVWMQFHEDLLTAVGVNRADEAQPE